MPMLLSSFSQWSLILLSGETKISEHDVFICNCKPLGLLSASLYIMGFTRTVTCHCCPLVLCYFSALRFNVTEEIWQQCLSKFALWKVLIALNYGLRDFFYVMLSLLLFFCFTYLLNKDLYLPLVENFPLDSGTRVKVFLLSCYSFGLSIYLDLVWDNV